MSREIEFTDCISIQTLEYRGHVALRVVMAQFAPLSEAEWSELTRFGASS